MVKQPDGEVEHSARRQLKPVLSRLLTVTALATLAVACATLWLVSLAERIDPFDFQRRVLFALLFALLGVMSYCASYLLRRL